MQSIKYFCTKRLGKIHAGAAQKAQSKNLSTPERVGGKSVSEAWVTVSYRAEHIVSGLASSLLRAFCD